MYMCLKICMYALCIINFAFDSVSNLVSPSPIFLGRCGCWRSTYFTVVQRWCSEGLRFEPGRAMRDARDGFFAATRQWCFKPRWKGKRWTKHLETISTVSSRTMDSHGIIINQFWEHTASTCMSLHGWHLRSVGWAIQLFNFHSKNGI